MAASAATFTVTNTNDAGPGTLRQAILGASSSSGADLIAFAIPSSGTRQIVLSSTLPPLVDDAGVTIDGFTQPGASPNIDVAGDDAVRLVELDSSEFTTIIIQSNANVLRGLHINGLSPFGCCAGVLIERGSGNRLEGMLIRRQNVGVTIQSSGNLVGGLRPQDRNWFRRDDVGVLLYGSLASNNAVRGNFIGEIRPGFDERNFVGVVIDEGASNNVVGGLGTGAGNVISGNEFGVSVQRNTTVPGPETIDNRVEGNLIGTDPRGFDGVGNSTGVGIFSAVRTRIGGSAAAARNLVRGFFGYGVDVVVGRETVIEGNVIEAGPPEQVQSSSAIGIRLVGTAIENTLRRNRIAFNGGPGIQIERNLPPQANRNSISQNSISGNGEIGIDLGADGVTLNDPGDSDTGANDLQNFPTLGSAHSGANSTSASGVLESAPGMSYQIEIFASSACDRSGNGEGERFLGSRSVTTDGAGLASFVFFESTSVPIGSFLTATATDPNGNTSEFSPCRVVVAGAPPGVEAIPNLGTTGLVVLAVLLAAIGCLVTAAAID
jgi:Right handed beta helix region